jgi:GAF domain-containing protein
MSKTIPWWARRASEEANEINTYDLTNESLRLDDLCEKVCSRIKSFLEFDFVAIQFLRPASRHIETVHGIGEAKKWSERARHYVEPDPSLRDIQADIVQTGLTEIITGSDPRFDEWIFDEYKHRNYSRIFIPLVVINDDDGEPLTDWIQDLHHEIVVQSSNEESSRLALKIGPDLTCPGLEVIGTIEAGYCNSTRQISTDETVSLFALVSELAVDIYKLLLPYGLRSIADNLRQRINANAIQISFLYDEYKTNYIYNSSSGKFFPHQITQIEQYIQQACKSTFECDRGAASSSIIDEHEIFQVLEESSTYLVAFPFVVNHSQVFYDGQILNGTIYISLRKKSDLSNSVISKIRTFSSRLEDTLWNLLTYLKMREQTRQLRTLHAVSNSLAQAPEDGNLLNYIAWSALNVLAADVITIYEYVESEKIFLTPPSIAGRLKIERNMRTELYADDIPYRLLRSGINQYTSKTRQEKIFNSNRENSFVEREHIVSTAGILLKVGQENVGVLFINYRNHHYFRDGDKQIIDTLASAAAIAIKNQRWLNVLSEVDRDIISTLEEDKLLSRIVRKAVQVTAADLGEIRLLDIANQELVMKARFPESVEIDEKWNRTSVKNSGEGITGWVAQHKRPRIVYNVEDKDDQAIYKPFFQNSKSELCVPLVGRDDNILGVLNVESAQVGNFDGRDQKRLRALADLVVVALQNVQNTEQRMAVERVATLDHIARSIFHRMNNYLGAADVWAKKIADGNASSPELANKIRLVLKQALDDRERIKSWMTDLQPIDVRQSIYSALSRVSIPAKIKPTIALGDDNILAKVLGIQGQLEDSFFNIIKNAVDSMPSGGNLSISLLEVDSNSQGWIVAQIADSGIGIPAEQISEIFKPGYTTKVDHDGEGLWLAKSYIDNLGGQITVESPLGKGTKFSILLPSC